MRNGSDVAYLDSSALVKLIVEERESEALRDRLRGWPRRLSSRLSIVETLRAIERRGPAANEFARSLLAHVALLALDDEVLIAAVAIRPSAVRSLDAIHIASAQALGRDLAAFVSYDARQLEAAESAGLPCASPR